ncbi:MAG: sigma-70 family RNA polymerase sigma factor [bacterium]|nr:sigma-70 family RNA polymerase sigma factor [bacterium]
MGNGDYELVQRVIGGDEAAFEELVRDNQRMVYSLALRMLRNPTAAEDVAQEAFIKAYRNLEMFRSDGKFSTWIYRITYNAAIDHIRKRKDEVELADWDGASDTDTPEENVISRETSQRVREALKRISPEYRRVLELFYFSGKKYREVAEIMDLPINTVKTYIYRGKKELLKVVQKEGTAAVYN